MISALLCDSDEKEQKAVEGELKDQVAYRSDERLDLRKYGSARDAERHIAEELPCDLSVLEIKDDDDIGFSKSLRREREGMDMMLIAEAGISPMKYMTPDIRACSLLLRPFSDDDMRSVTKDLMASFFARRESPAEGGSIVIENREGRTVVPFSQVYYIEVREKRVFFRLRDRELAKYDSLENIKQMLPANFVQSHRSFIFNASFLDRIKLSENTVYLDHGIEAPLSRSYKASVREYLDGLKSK